MAEIVLTNAYVSLDSNVLSAWGNSVQIDYSAAEQDDTAFGDNTKSNIGGLKDWSIQLEFNQDFTAGAVDDLLFPLIGTCVPFEIRPDAAAVGVDNPSYTGTALVTNYKPISGKVGDKASTGVTLKPGGASPTLLRSAV